MSTGTAKEFEALFDDWESHFKTADDAEKSELEQDVAIKIIGPVLRLLGWENSDFKCEVTCRIVAGTTVSYKKADIVLLKNGSLPAEIGNVCAVIELKRPSVRSDSSSATFSSAEEQAQSYANSLQSPIYAVINGAEFKAWHRRIASPSKLVLKLSREDCVSDFNKLRKVLGRGNVLGYYSSVAETENGSLAAQTTEYISSEIEPYQVGFALEDGYILSSHSVDTVLSRTLWWGHVSKNAQSRAIKLTIHGEYAAWLEHAGLFVDQLLRVVLHRSNIEFQAENHHEWITAFEKIELHLPDSVHDEKKKYSSIRERRDARAAMEIIGSPEDLATRLASELDEWVGEAVKFRVRQITDGRDARSVWGHPEVRKELSPLIFLNVTWMKSTLITSSRDDYHGSLRYGPSTVSYIVDSIYLAAAIQKIIPNMHPKHEVGDVSPTFCRNLVCRAENQSPEEMGFSYALSNAEQHDFETVMVLISCELSSNRGLRGQQKMSKVGKSIQRALRIGARPQARIEFKMTSETRHILKEKGWDAFRTQLETVLSAAISSSEAEVNV